MKHRYAVKKKIGKKGLRILMITGIIVTLSGCGRDNRSITEKNNTIEKTSEEVSKDKATEITATVELTKEPTPIPSVTPPPVTAKNVVEQSWVTRGELTDLGIRSEEEYADRALTAVNSKEGVFVSWRLYQSDSKEISFTLERNGSIIYTGGRTNFKDADGKAGDVYTLTANEGVSVKGEQTLAWNEEYQEFILQAPNEQIMPDGAVTSYTANDMSVGDLDGDGQLELIVKWYPDNAQDNSKDGYTGTTFLDAYDIDHATGKAELMWRIDLGLNIRSGAHYTQFQVWDYDGDGKAEVLCKTADGTTTYDGNLKENGHVGAVSMADLNISARGTKENYDFRQHTGRIGRIVLGQEYLTAFHGETGKIIDTVKYVPERGPFDETTGTYDTRYWGLKNGALAEKNDGYANRCDRFLAATAYLDEGTASAIFARGYYGKTAVTAWKLVNDKLVMKWAFDAPNESQYAAQGNHGLSVNDVDGDGYDEIIYGSLVLNEDGEPLYTTCLGHGDAMHVSDWNGDGKLEVFQVHEESTATYHMELHDALTGTILWGVNNGKDTGRGMAADIDPRYSGAELWAAVNESTYDALGNPIYPVTKPGATNFSLFWDGDLLMELFDHNNSTDCVPQVRKWDYENLKEEVLLEAACTSTSNGTKGNAGLIADIYGDWREEIIVRDSKEHNKIRIYSTTIETTYNIPCLLEDRAYREGVAWQNTAYNQPANLSDLLSRGVTSAEITEVAVTADTVSLKWEAASDGVYGHSVEGYHVYRAEKANAKTRDYKLAGVVKDSILSYSDTGLSADKNYSYKIVAIIDGQQSYVSFATTVKTAVK